MDTKKTNNTKLNIFDKKIYIPYPSLSSFHHFTHGWTSPISLEFFFGIWEIHPLTRVKPPTSRPRPWFWIGKIPGRVPYTDILCVKIFGALTQHPRPGPLGSIHHFFWMLYGFLPKERWWVFHAFPICAISFDLKVTGRSAFLFGCTCPRGHRRLDLAEFVESLE